MNEARARDYLAAAGLDALVVHTPSNVAYVTGFRWWLASAFREYMIRPGGSGEPVQRSFAFWAPGARPGLVLEPYMVVNAADLDAEIFVAGGAPYGPGESDDPLAALLGRAPAGGDLAEALAAGLASRGLDDARLGIEPERLPDDLRHELRRRLPKAELLDCTNLLRLVRAVKTDAEIALLARSAEAAEDAASAAFALAAPGRTLDALLEAFRVRATAHGADLDHFSLSPGGIGIAMDTRHPLEPGSVHFADYGCVYRGYYSDSGTTLSLGEPGPKTLELQAAVRDAIAAGEAELRPGAVSSAVQATMVAALAERGITESYPHGHGLGLDARDYPILTPPSGLPIRDDCVDVSSDLPLEEGMVLNLEAPYFTLGAGAVHCERTFVVTATGSRPLAVQDRSAPVVAGA